MVVTTLILNAPVNDAVDGWTIGNLPADWAAQRDQWELGHAIRSYIGLAGLLLALASVIWHAESA